MDSGRVLATPILLFKFCHTMTWHDGMINSLA